MTNEDLNKDEKEKSSDFNLQLVNDKNDDTILTRVYVAQCKLYGLGGAQKNISEGFRELYELREYKEAYYPLGSWYYDQSDYQQAYNWFKKCNTGQAKYSMSLLLQQQSNPNLEKALHLMTESANQGNKYAQCMLGIYYQYGIFSLVRDVELAKMWYERSAIQGFAEAQIALCNLLLQLQQQASSWQQKKLDGVILQQDNEQEKKEIVEEEEDKLTIINEGALDWLYKAENQENASAFIRLGSLHEEGIFVQKDNQKAIEFYLKATKVTFAPIFTRSLAHYLVGIKYYLGEVGLGQNESMAYQHFLASANLGYAPAQRMLGLMYCTTEEQVDGSVTTKDLTKANDLFQSAASQGDVRSLSLIAHTTAAQKEEEGGLKSIIELHENAAKAGSLSSQLSLAQLYLNTGRFTLAYKWYEIASKSTPITLPTTKINYSNQQQKNQQRHHYRRLRRSTRRVTEEKQQQQPSLDIISIGSLAQRNTARLMVARFKLNGWYGVQQDPLCAFQEFYALAHDVEFSDAFYWLAACYEEGIVDVNGKVLVELDMDLAFEWYSKSAHTGDIDSQFQVAYMLANGYQSNKQEGRFVKNREAAFEWYMKAAERGHAMSQYSIGLYFEHGLDREVDIKIAIDWYEKAAQQGEVTLAMVRLARLLVAMTMDNVPKAYDWLKRAILKGDVSALRELATFYKNGLMIFSFVEAQEGDHELLLQQQQKRAFDVFQQAANQDDAMSWHALSRYYEAGLGSVIPVDLEKSVLCLQRAEELGYSDASLDLANFYYRHYNIEDALRQYTRLTETYTANSPIGYKSRLEMTKIVIFGNHGSESDRSKVHSQLKELVSTSTTSTKNEDTAELLELLGYCAEHGIGTSINKKSAASYYISCISFFSSNDTVSQSKLRSLVRLVDLYMEEKQNNSALIYLHQLKPYFSELKDIEEPRRMKYYLGYFYLKGLGDDSIMEAAKAVEKNEDEGIYWLSEAADEGEGDAAYELGRYFQETDDQEEAWSRYEQGVTVGHAGCMRALALLLLAEEENDQYDDEEVYDGGEEILRLLEMAAELHDVEAIYQLGVIYETGGFGTVISTRNLETALVYYVKAAEINHELAMVKAGEVLGNVMGRYAEAVQWLQKAVTLKNNIMAKVMLVSYNFQGLTSSQHDDIYNFKVLQYIISEGFKLMEKEEPTTRNKQEEDEHLAMNKAGLGLAFCILGQCYELGKGIYVNLSMAKEWYHRSIVISENVEAMWRLGFIYSTFENDNTNALEWYRRAAEEGRHRESHYQLGLFHARGLGELEVNTIAAQKYFSKACEQGHPQATYELARIVWHCHGDYIYGYELFNLASQLQVPDALRELGHLSHTGFLFHGVVIVQQDYKRAFAFYCQAAQMGDPIAALMVGNYFEQGYLLDELGQDYERALQWYESAYRLNGGKLAELAIGKLKHIMAHSIADPKDAEDMREEAFVWLESAANDSMESIQGVYAKIMVALYHLHGWGRKSQDAKTGFNMLLDIAVSGGTEAFVSVARCYEDGVGTEHNMMKAVDYWEMAADLDDQGAMIRVGEIYELGLAGPIDKETANIYYDQAEMSGATTTRLIRYDRDNNRNSGHSLESMSSSSTSTSSASYFSSPKTLH